MGSSQSTVNVSNEIYNSIMNNLEQKGVFSKVGQVNNLEDVTIVADGSNSVVLIGNYNTIDFSTMLDASAEATAETLAEIANDLTNNAQGAFFNNTDISTMSETDIQNMVSTYLKSQCVESDLAQYNQITNGYIQATNGGVVSITNQNDQQMNCIMSALSKATSDLQASVENTVTNDSGINWTLIIIVVVIVLAIVAVIMGGSFKWVVVLIIVLIIAAGAYFIYVTLTKEKEETETANSSDNSSDNSTDNSSDSANNADNTEQFQLYAPLNNVSPATYQYMPMISINRKNQLYTPAGIVKKFAYIPAYHPPYAQ